MLTVASVHELIPPRFRKEYKLLSYISHVLENAKEFTFRSFRCRYCTSAKYLILIEDLIRRLSYGVEVHITGTSSPSSPSLPPPVSLQPPVLPLDDNY